MKRYLPFILISGFANAHSQYPQQLEPIKTVQRIHKVDFNLTNLNKENTCFSTEINGVIYSPYKVCLNHNQTKNMSVYVQNIPNEWAKNVVCTISDSDGQFRTRMCTTSITYFHKP